MNPVYAIILAVLLSISPVSELRGGIPFLVANGMNVIGAAIICTFFNILIIIPIFLFLDYVHKHLVKWKFYSRIFNFMIKPIRKRSKKVERKVESYGIIALSLFVAIPLPITGAWTGALVAWLLNLNRMRSFFAIALGVIIAAIIVSLATTGIISLFS
jgi:uncharacterized membrane protein